MKKIYKFGISLFIGIAVLIAIYHYFSPVELFKTLDIFSFKLLPAYVIVSFLIMSCLVLRWQNILKCLGQPVKFLKLFEYKLACYAFNYLTPTMHIGGEPIRAYLLKNHNVSMPKAASSVLLDDAIELSLDAVFGLLGFLIIMTNYAISGKATALIIATLLVVIFILFRFFYLHLKGRGSISSTMEFLRLHKLKSIQKIIEKIKVVESNTIFVLRWRRGPFLRSMFYGVVIWILMFFEYSFAMQIVGYTPNLMEIFLVLSFVAIAYIIPIPAAIGVLEAAQISVFMFLGIDVTTAIALTLIIRARDLFWTLLGLFFIYRHSRGAFKAFFEEA